MEKMDKQDQLDILDLLEDKDQPEREAEMDLTERRGARVLLGLRDLLEM